jgi:proline dehydrogenase
MSSQRPMTELIRSFAVLTLFRSNFLVKKAPSLYQRFPRIFQITARPIFDHFVAGESEVKAMQRVDDLKSKGIGTILDYAAESSPDFEVNVWQLQKAIEVMKQQPNGAVAVKLTALCSVEDLERTSRLISEGRESEVLKDPAFKNLMSRASEVCRYGVESKVAMYFDAEWLAVQPAIELATLELMKVWNKEHPWVHTTYQCYLKRTPAVAAKELAAATKHGFILGAKVVRGAYIVKETADAETHSLPNPICDNYETTNNQYNSIVKMLVGAKCVGFVLVATHNPESVDLAIHLNSSKVKYGQLLSMADNVSYDLASRKVPVFKYVPYGPMDEVMPYLLRRTQENSALFGSPHVQVERDQLKKAILDKMNLK